LSTRTVNKDRLEGALLEDRLLVLDVHAAPRSARLVALVNRGLYVEQAELFRAKLPGLESLTFLVGFDKIVQIFDPRYYADRDADLDRLFGQARLLVAPRAGQGQAALDKLMARPENRRFAAGVGWLPLPTAYADLSSTRVRQAAARGRIAEAVPVETRALLAATHAYGPPRRLTSGEEFDGYGLRLALLAALAATRPWAETAADLSALLRLAGSASRAGRDLRAWLRQAPATAEARAADLAAFQTRTRSASGR
jgi:hypothetical protein